ncbi:MAG: hypothetical protein ACTSVI_02765 [Promethearchaeota archaeon]
MPSQIFDPEKFLEISHSAQNCRVLRKKDKVKLKLRTKKKLYTYIADPETADALISKIECEIIEL